MLGWRPPAPFEWPVLSPEEAVRIAQEAVGRTVELRDAGRNRMSDEEIVAMWTSEFSLDKR